MFFGKIFDGEFAVSVNLVFDDCFKRNDTWLFSRIILSGVFTLEHWKVLIDDVFKFGCCEIFFRIQFAISSFGLYG